MNYKGLLFVLTSSCVCAGAWGDANLSEPGQNSSLEAYSPRGGEEVRFEVFRQGRPFGYHVIRFDRESDDRFNVTNDVHLRAGLGPVTLFNYRHQSTEVWENGELSQLEGKTRKSGKDLTVEAHRDGDSFVVDGSLFMGRHQGNFVPLSHWNAGQIDDAAILSSESGELIPISVEPIARETITVGSEEVEATRFRMTSELIADLWYDDEGRWLKFAFTARGQKIEYRLAALY